MGTLTVTFFVNASTQTLPPIEDEVLTQLHTDRQTLETLMINRHTYTNTKTRLIRYEQESTVNVLHESQRTDSGNHEIIKLLESSHDETSQYFDCLLQGNLYGNSVLSKDFQNKSISETKNCEIPNPLEDEPF